MSPAPAPSIQPPVISPPAGESPRLIWLLSAGVIAGLTVLYLFNPVEHAFYPACQFYQLTHLHCPGCGSLRALHHLTHGHVDAAFHSNPLLIATIPFLAMLGIGIFRNPANFKSLRRPATVWVILGGVILFGILRNLPGPAFAWMAP